MTTSAAEPWVETILSARDPEAVWSDIFDRLRDVALATPNPQTLHKQTVDPDRLLAESAWSLWARISDFAVVPYRQDQSPRLDFWGSDARNLTTEGDTRWVNYNMSHFSSRSTAS